MTCNGFNTGWRQIFLDVGILKATWSFNSKRSPPVSPLTSAASIR